MQNELCRLMRRPSRDCYAVALASLVGLLLSASASVAQQKSPPPAQGVTVPTFEGVPHSPLPPGEFVTWCGQNGRYILHTREGIFAYQGNVRVSPPLSIAVKPLPQCGQDGRDLISRKDRHVTRVDIETGKSVLLATYTTDVTPTISFSPDLQSVATDAPLQWTADAGNLRILPVNELRKKASKLIWSQDGSRMMVTSIGWVEVLDDKDRRIGGGSLPLPKKKWVEDGWFDVDQQSLFLFISHPDADTDREDDDASEPASIVRCSIANWKCKEVKSRAESLSVGGRGLVGTVEPRGKPRPDQSGSPPMYARFMAEAVYTNYLAELRDGTSKLLAQQVFSTAKGHFNFRVDIAPSGQQVLLSWYAQVTPDCPEVGAWSLGCQQGLMIDTTQLDK